MKTVAIALYILLGSALMTKVATTVYQLGSVMHHNAIVAQLQTNQQALTTQKQELETQLAGRTSLSSVLASSNEQFTAISNPIVISGSTQLASQL
ncbi:MAG: hypothetical protein WDZ94_04995 [Patescibacteria group bacterium]